MCSERVTEETTRGKAAGSRDSNVELLMQDKMRNEHIRGTAHVRSFGDQTRGTRLRWFDMFSKYISRRRLRFVCRRLKRRFMDAVKRTWN